MRYKKAKFFWKKNNLSKIVSCLEYDDKIEYYSFIKTCYAKEYRQIIITSELMIEIIKYFAINKNLLVYEIELVEDDNELKEELELLIANTRKNGFFFQQLIEKLNFLAEQSSIDIQRIYIKGRDTENNAVNFFIQSNGIIGINNESFESISNDVRKIIKEYLM